MKLPKLPRRTKHPNKVFMSTKAAKKNNLKNGDIVGGYEIVISDDINQKA